MTRAGFLARLRRLERPRRTQDAMRQELERLERLYPPLSPGEIEALTNEQLDDMLTSMASERSPRARIGEIREQLMTPAERALRDELRAKVMVMTPEQQEAELEAMLNRERT